MAFHIIAFLVGAAFFFCGALVALIAGLADHKARSDGEESLLAACIIFCAVGFVCLVISFFAWIVSVIERMFG